MNRWMNGIFSYEMQHKYRDHSRLYSTLILAVAILATILFAHAATGVMLEGDKTETPFGGFTMKNTSMAYKPH